LRGGSGKGGLLGLRMGLGLVLVGEVGAGMRRIGGRMASARLEAASTGRCRCRCCWGSVSGWIVSVGWEVAGRGLAGAAAPARGTRRIRGGRRRNSLRRCSV
jgi:hypothetical protein